KTKSPKPSKGIHPVGSGIDPQADRRVLGIYRLWTDQADSRRHCTISIRILKELSMRSFLKNTAEEILADYPALDQLVLILPNRRAGLFLAKHLGSLISEPQWMPQIKTIEDVFYGLAGQKPSDQLTLI